ncbi:Zn(2)-C6 fungal-type domain-containing protein [Phanerochaete sordida]|uniref:Zn(2)-C6 fungal-type domain-containing protein n=1 Tax=Phanerochaete sordida TaxID=48140 RepID=A0A9P3G433_9APHY|nr:Zn(2)-C6 fungal-type domain-containing protein [Phanerochaete sordida]
MQPRHLTPEISDEDGRGASPASSARGAASRRRSTRACDQCRRTKSKCERSDVDNVCRACSAMGVSCTYVGPSHKRGPPKGYILALERRLHQVEALLGTIISSDDPRARGLIQDLSRDQLAAHIIRRVKIGPFGPRGRLQQPFGSTKEDFLTAIMAGSGDDSPGRYGEENYALVSPDRDWQDRLHAHLQPAPRQNNLQYPTQTSAPYTLPSLRQISSPAPLPQHQQQHHQPQQQQQQQQGHPLMPGGLPGVYSTKLETGSPVGNTALLAPINTSYGSHSPLSHSPQPAPYHGGVGSAGARLSWDGFNGYQRLGDGGGSDDGGEPKARYELAPGDGGLLHARGEPYALPRVPENASDPQRWYYTNQQAVG